MHWSEDLDTERKMQPKLGRRANQGTRQSSEEFGSADDILEATSDQNIQAPMRARKAGGWADETLKSAKNKNATNIIEQERFRDQKIDLEDDIPVIPDIDEIPDDMLSSDVAQAPSVAINRVTTYKELDKDLLKQNAFSQFGDINLSHLTRFMYAEKDIRDPDVVWTKELLFNELITEYRGSVDDKE
ncbi:Intraflagellar transport 43 [Carabus blaptoides fortunei]